MRKALKEHLVKALARQLRAASFGHELADSSNSAADVCFQIRSESGYCFFLHIVCDDGSDSFRAYLVWSRGTGYPRSPSSLDLSLPVSDAIQDLLQGDSGEVNLAAIADGDLPWAWNLDRSYGNWKAKLDALTADAADGRLDESAYSAHLLAMPRKCSVTDAKVEADQAVRQIMYALGHHAMSIIRQIGKTKEGAIRGTDHK